ncbi:UNVERIFIED_CONTAM: hypothetical protein FKN15_039019 [Acipenser sinensis]
MNLNGNGFYLFSSFCVPLARGFPVKDQKTDWFSRSSQNIAEEDVECFTEYMELWLQQRRTEGLSEWISRALRIPVNLASLDRLNSRLAPCGYSLHRDQDRNYIFRVKYSGCFVQLQLPWSLSLRGQLVAAVEDASLIRLTVDTKGPNITVQGTRGGILSTTEVMGKTIDILPLWIVSGYYAYSMEASCPLVSSLPTNETVFHILKRRMGLIKRGGYDNEILTVKNIAVKQTASYSVIEDHDFVQITIPTAEILQAKKGNYVLDVKLRKRLGGFGTRNQIFVMKCPLVTVPPGGEHIHCKPDYIQLPWSLSLRGQLVAAVEDASLIRLTVDTKGPNITVQGTRGGILSTTEVMGKTIDILPLWIVSGYYAYSMEASCPLVSSLPTNETVFHILKRRMGLIKRGGYDNEILTVKNIAVKQTASYSVIEDHDFVQITIPTAEILQAKKCEDLPGNLYLQSFYKVDVILTFKEMPYKVYWSMENQFPCTDISPPPIKQSLAPSTASGISTGSEYTSDAGQTREPSLSASSLDTPSPQTSMPADHGYKESTASTPYERTALRFPSAITQEPLDQSDHGNSKATEHFISKEETRSEPTEKDTILPTELNITAPSEASLSYPLSAGADAQMSMPVLDYRQPFTELTPAAHPTSTHIPVQSEGKEHVMVASSTNPLALITEGIEATAKAATPVKTSTGQATEDKSDVTHGNRSLGVRTAGPPGAAEEAFTSVVEGDTTRGETKGTAHTTRGRTGQSDTSEAAAVLQRFSKGTAAKPIGELMGTSGTSHNEPSSPILSLASASSSAVEVNMLSATSATEKAGAPSKQSSTSTSVEDSADSEQTHSTASPTGSPSGLILSAGATADSLVNMSEFNTSPNKTTSDSIMPTVEKAFMGVIPITQENDTSVAESLHPAQNSTASPASSTEDAITKTTGNSYELASAGTPSAPFLANTFQQSKKGLPTSGTVTPSPAIPVNPVVRVSQLTAKTSLTTPAYETNHRSCFSQVTTQRLPSVSSISVFSGSPSNILSSDLPAQGKISSTVTTAGPNPLSNASATTGAAAFTAANTEDTLPALLRGAADKSETMTSSAAVTNKENQVGSPRQ